MAVTISTTAINGIDADYPVAGQDNDSQGFRDNFSAIKTSLSATAADLTALDTNSAKKNVNNDFNGNQISDADLIANTEVVYAGGTISAPVNVNWNSGHYQSITIDADVTLTLTEWPTSPRLGKMRLEIKRGATAGTRVLTFAVSGGGTLKTGPDWPTPFNITSTTDPIFVDFWTRDGGATVYGQYHGSFG